MSTRSDLTVVITSHADNAECFETVRSIYQTAATFMLDGRLKIVIVDDASPEPLLNAAKERGPESGLHIVRNKRRIGCGPSRYVGACVADGEWLLFTDSHMRFTQDWLKAWLEDSGFDRNVLYCGSCLGLSEKDMNLNTAKPYFGATWNFCGQDRNKPREQQVFECVWQPNKVDGGNNYEIPAPMGASYFVHRERFLELDALRGLRSWGGDEQELALKYWLSGGAVRFLRNVRIGHKFKTGKLNKIQPWEVLYNKLFVMHTCLPPHLAERLQKKMHRDGHMTAALKRLFEDWHLVEAQRARNGKLFSVTFDWYLQHFGLSFPKE